MTTVNACQNDTCNSAYNPFPEPQTIPSGWDMSEFIATQQADSTVSEEDSVESEFRER